MALVVAVHSYKGGTGKTILSVNLAASICLEGKRVALLDLDYSAPSIYTYFPKEIIGDKGTLNDALMEKKEFEDCIFNATNLIEGSGELFVGLANHQTEYTREMIRRDAKSAANDARKLFRWVDLLKKPPFSADVILLDTAPGLNFLSINSISVCDVSILLMRLLNADLSGTKEMIDGLHAKLRSEILLLVNQLPPEFMEGENAQNIYDLVDKFILADFTKNKPKFGGIVVKDMDLVRLEASNMLELLRTGKEIRDIHVLKQDAGSFTTSVNKVTRLIIDR
ncbi:MAG: ParA family protein [Candidatus Heimdallarchaeota archaeon]|nr:ParA family protein [Candidatus Heimdallarchaeota archaeon]